jgi:mono/diheme cytochrome c family protein
MKPDRKRGQARNPAREVHPPARSRSEDPEPTAARTSLPVWLFIVLALALFYGMVYLDNHAGGFNPVVYQRYRSTNELVALVPYDPAKEAFNKGLAVYGQACLACHQPSGTGTPGQFPPLAGADWVLESDPGRIIRIVLGGLQGPIEVKGNMYNNAMPPWGPTLTDEQVAHVLTYIRQAWGNSASAVTTEQVTKVRQDTANRSIPWTAAELLQIPVAQ